MVPQWFQQQSDRQLWRNRRHFNHHTFGSKASMYDRYVKVWSFRRCECNDTEVREWATGNLSCWAYHDRAAVFITCSAFSCEQWGKRCWSFGRVCNDEQLTTLSHVISERINLWLWDWCNIITLLEHMPTSKSLTTSRWWIDERSCKTTIRPIANLVSSSNRFVKTATTFKKPGSSYTSIYTSSDQYSRRLTEPIPHTL
jgi:hypothetical protein